MKISMSSDKRYCPEQDSSSNLKMVSKQQIQIIKINMALQA